MNGPRHQQDAASKRPYLKTRREWIVLNSIAKRLTLVAATGLWSLTASAGTPPSLHGAIPGPAGKYSLKDTSGTSNKAVGVDGRVGIMVVLDGEPAAMTYRHALVAAGSHGVTAATVAGAASKQTVSKLRGQQAQFLHSVDAKGIHYEELFRAQRTINGIAMRVLPKEMQRLAKLPGVARVEYLPFETLGNITSVPFIGAPQVWTGVNSLGLPFDATGTGVRVGIIDTGIDYLHPDFGGSGSLIDYQKNADRQHINPVDPENPGVNYFPTAKVVGGFDFVGDFYDGSNSPVPDPNPADCNGHGSHVAGTVAGYGVNNDGTPYAAGYDPLPKYSGFRIGPGVAPGAELYALRVFGCGGGTSVLTEALEWAVDPNDDGDLSDHLDVVNMSLGAPEGFPSDVDAVAADTAALAGTIVVAASGNNGSGFFVASSPAAGRHVISVAAIVDGGLTGVLLHESSPAAGDYPAAAARYVNPDNSPPPAPSGQTGQVVLANDGVDPTTDACESTFTSNASGKIVLIDRGTCNFTVKVLNAQANGAKGVIVANNVDGAPPLVMGGVADSKITIPAVGISKAAGDQLKSQVAAGSVKVLFATASAGDTFASFSSRGPTIDVDGSVMLKPDLAAPGLDIPSVQTGVTCDDQGFSGCLSPAPGGYIPGGQLLVLSGTSMATPHVAGMMAVLRQINPDASVDELKALAMNSATHDVTLGAGGSGQRYSASSIGAGRIDVAHAAASKISAYNADADGSTSVTFDVEPVGSQSYTHDIRIVNGANVDQPVELSIDAIGRSSGVAFSLVGSPTTTLPPGPTVVSVALTADGARMSRSCDGTLPETESLFELTLTRECIAEESALLKISSGGIELARVPLYAAIRPHSSLATTGMPAGSPAAGTTNLVVAGADVCTDGGLVAGPSCNDNLASEEESLVSPFELQVKGAYDPTLPGFANLHYAGINFRPDPVNGDDEYLFGIAAYGKWGTPSAVAYDICIDTDGDGKFDKTVFNTDTGSVGPLFGMVPNPSNAYFTAVLNLPFVFFDSPLNLVGAGAADTAVLDNNVMILGAHLSSLALAAPTKITYGIAVCPAVDPLCTGFAPSTQCTGADALASFGPYTYDPAHPGVDGTGKVLLEDLNGAALHLPYDTQNLGANGSLGLLLIHHHNTTDKTAEAVVLDDLFANGFGGD